VSERFLRTARQDSDRKQRPPDTAGDPLTRHAQCETVTSICGLARSQSWVFGSRKGETVAERKNPDRDVKEELDRRLAEIELLKHQAQQQGLAFSAPTKEQLEKKIRGETANSPYIYSMSWTSATTRGSAASFQVYFSNPDASGYYPVFASVFFGVANFFGNIADGFVGRDDRWPYLSSPPINLSSGGTGSPSFLYTTPSVVPPSTYLGNVVLWRGEFHDTGAYFDRGGFYVTLT
jgi:hypothetical protein